MLRETTHTVIAAIVVLSAQAVGTTLAAVAWCQATARRKACRDRA
jgi:hypothetical protein